MSVKFLSGGGEMGARMRAHDWAETPLGPPETWPQSLRTVVRILLTSRYQMWMGWGEDLTFFYNDAYRPTLGVKHGWALGRPAREVWKEIWPDIGPRIDHVLEAARRPGTKGCCCSSSAAAIPKRPITPFPIRPLPTMTARWSGCCVVTEETERVIGERRVASLRQLASEMAGKNTPPSVLAAANNVLAANPRDLPFTLLYLIGERR